ncbi:unnamed protein product [Ceutorhynchus assimilis]|uniref:Uncharacterized protein n=1 Tax=Ceutorhynchus assimilis TaxID=467358 RepID=A0A9N9QFQ3_9CUCU|nr:unnamed protein product [Ceutorhynchus assimilis]
MNKSKQSKQEMNNRKDKDNNQKPQAKTADEKKTEQKNKLTRCTKDRLAILAIPPEFSEPKTEFFDLSKAQLNSEDKCIVELILNYEEQQGLDVAENSPPVRRNKRYFNVYDGRFKKNN